MLRQWIPDFGLHFLLPSREKYASTSQAVSPQSDVFYIQPTLPVMHIGLHEGALCVIFKGKTRPRFDLISLSFTSSCLTSLLFAPSILPYDPFRYCHADRSPLLILA